MSTSILMDKASIAVVGDRFVASGLAMEPDAMRFANALFRYLGMSHGAYTIDLTDLFGVTPSIASGFVTFAQLATQGGRSVVAIAHGETAQQLRSAGFEGVATIRSS